jgi:hypothetical protein
MEWARIWLRPLAVLQLADLDQGRARPDGLSAPSLGQYNNAATQDAATRVRAFSGRTLGD